MIRIAFKTKSSLIVLVSIALFSLLSNAAERTNTAVTDALFDAIRRNDPQAVQELLTAGADVDAQNTWGVTPLYEATSRNYPKIAKLLIQHGADVSNIALNELTPEQKDMITRIVQQVRQEKRAAVAAVMEAQPHIPKDIAHLITGFEYDYPKLNE